MTSPERAPDLAPLRDVLSRRQWNELVSCVEVTMALLRHHDTRRTDLATGFATCRCGLPALLCDRNGVLRRAGLLDDLPFAASHSGRATH